MVNQGEKKLRDFPIIKTESIMEYVGEDKVKWYDIASFGVARAARNKSKFYIYEIKHYKVGDKMIKDDKEFQRVEFW